MVGYPSTRLWSVQASVSRRFCMETPPKKNRGFWRPVLRVLLRRIIIIPFNVLCKSKTIVGRLRHESSAFLCIFYKRAAPMCSGVPNQIEQRLQGIIIKTAFHISSIRTRFYVHLIIHLMHGQINCYANRLCPKRLNLLLIYKPSLNIDILI
jgi:hypothetical protein